MKMVHSSYTEEAVKAFYAISALVRNNERGQEMLYLEGGDILLQVLDNFYSLLQISCSFCCIPFLMCSLIATFVSLKTSCELIIVQISLL
jgi:hypothetical protein